MSPMASFFSFALTFVIATDHCRGVCSTETANRVAAPSAAAILMLLVLAAPSGASGGSFQVGTSKLAFQKQKPFRLLHNEELWKTYIHKVNFFLHVFQVDLFSAKWNLVGNDVSKFSFLKKNLNARHGA